eukprot:1057380-Pelagomonas_calceolata.AAC.1
MNAPRPGLRRLLELQEKHSERTGRANESLDAAKVVCYYDPDITHINAWRIFTAKKRDRSSNPPLRYKNYFAPMIEEKWALLMLRNTGFMPASIEPATRAEIECARCEICNYPGGKEPLKSEPPHLDMYIY